MKYLLQIILTAALSYVSQLFLPWWTMVIVAALMGLIFYHPRTIVNWSAGFIAILLLWGMLAQLQLAKDGGMLAELMGNTLQGYFSGAQLVFVVAALGGLLGGLGAMTGALLRKIVTKEPALS